MNKMTQENFSDITLPVEDCYPDRETIAILHTENGQVTKMDNINYAIKYRGEYKVLLPCNLPKALQTEGLHIRFAGEVKQAGPDEMWAAQPFVLTSCKVLNGHADQ